MDTSRLQSLFGLEGKRAVVTGGSRGIGYMIADGLLDAGADVIISARKENQVAEAVESLSAKGNIEGIPADLSTDEGLEHLAAEVAQRWDRLDILCNNAGASWGEP
ncbi:MAG: SDR family NAD(P)-dependent oxidoreductase, partial [Actinobacteria bacterium]|nr:SDR family NAD(P)-dependent oxidoreductase [Actinomycetota bacterium]